ncbi:unnamed protein product [Arctogadus glacialis]
MFWTTSRSVLQFHNQLDATVPPTLTGGCLSCERADQQGVQDAVGTPAGAATLPARFTPHAPGGGGFSRGACARSLEVGGAAFFLVGFLAGFSVWLPPFARHPHGLLGPQQRPPPCPTRHSNSSNKQPVMAGIRTRTTCPYSPDDRAYTQGRATTDGRQAAYQDESVA